MKQNVAWLVITTLSVSLFLGLIGLTQGPQGFLIGLGSGLFFSAMFLLTGPPEEES